MAPRYAPWVVGLALAAQHCGAPRARPRTDLHERTGGLPAGDPAGLGATDLETPAPEPDAGAAVARVITPIAVPGMHTATQLALGSQHTCVRTADATVMCWGANTAGQLGDGTTTDRATPGRVAGLTGVQQVAVGLTHACALVAGAVVCWGDNAHGQLGDGTTTNRLVPTAVVGVTAVVQIALGPEMSAARGATRGVWWWGVAPDRVVDGEVRSADGFATEPQALDARDATDLALGGRAICAVRHPTTSRPAATPPLFRCFGVDTARTDLSGTADRFELDAPGPVAELTHDLVNGRGHLCVLLQTGTVQCRGSNDVGQLGDGTTTSRPSFVPVPNLTDVLQIASNGWGPLGTVCALRADATVWCWGGTGALRVGAIGTPTQVPGLANVAEIAVGLEHACARLRDGTVWCWGSNARGQLGFAGAPDAAAPRS